MPLGLRRPAACLLPDLLSAQRRLVQASHRRVALRLPAPRLPGLAGDPEYEAQRRLYEPLNNVSNCLQGQIGRRAALTAERLVQGCRAALWQRRIVLPARSSRLLPARPTWMRQPQGQQMILMGSRMTQSTMPTADTKSMRGKAIRKSSQRQQEQLPPFCSACWPTAAPAAGAALGGASAGGSTAAPEEAACCAGAAICRKGGAM